LLSSHLPKNTELASSLSFYKIQYLLLKKKLLNASSATQFKSTKALEEALLDAQKQLIESEAYCYYLNPDIKPSK
jgi:hypothetical protein